MICGISDSQKVRFLVVFSFLTCLGVQPLSMSSSVLRLLFHILDI